MDTGNAFTDPVKVDPAEQMRTFNRLSADVRKIVQFAPCPLDARQVLGIQIRHKTKAAIFLSKAILREFPEWRPI